MDPFTIIIVGSYSNDHQVMEWLEDKDFRDTTVIYFRFKSWMQKSHSSYDLLNWGQFDSSLPEGYQKIMGKPSGLKFATLGDIKKFQNEFPDYVKSRNPSKFTLINCDEEHFKITKVDANSTKIQWDTSESRTFYNSLVRIIDTRKTDRTSNVPGLQGIKPVTAKFKEALRLDSTAPYLIHGLGPSGLWFYSLVSKTKKTYFFEKITEDRLNVFKNGRNDPIIKEIIPLKDKLSLGDNVIYSLLKNIRGSTRVYLQDLKDQQGITEPDEEIVVAWIPDVLTGRARPFLFVGVGTIGLESVRAFPDTEFYKNISYYPNADDCYSQMEVGSVWHAYQRSSIQMATWLNKNEKDFLNYIQAHTGNFDKSAQIIFDNYLRKEDALPMDWLTYKKAIYPQNIRLPPKDMWDLSRKAYQDGLILKKTPMDIINLCLKKTEWIFRTVFRYFPKLLQGLSANSPLETPFDLKQIFFHSTREALNGSNGSSVSNKSPEKASTYGMMDIARPLFLVENSDLEDSHFKALQSVLSVILNMCENTIKKSGDITSVQNIDGWITAVQDFPLPLLNFTATSESSFSQDNFSRKALQEDLWSILGLGPFPSSDIISASISDTLFTKLKSYGEQLKAISKTEKPFKILAVVGIGSARKSVLQLVVGELLPKETDFALLCADEKTKIHFNYSRYDFELNLELIMKVYERIQENITKAIADQLLDYINNHFAV